MTTTTNQATMSRATASKINQAIRECDRFIALESRRISELRPADVQKHLDFCVAHKDRLLHMLEGSAA